MGVVIVVPEEDIRVHNVDVRYLFRENPLIFFLSCVNVSFFYSRIPE